MAATLPNPQLLYIIINIHNMKMNLNTKCKSTHYGQHCTYPKNLTYLLVLINETS